ncbi:MAG: hypothetical protein HEEMFOPI_01921 [Holosporales bacterium]
MTQSHRRHMNQIKLLIIPSKINPDQFEVVSGERRLRAAQKLGLMHNNKRKNG